LEESILKIFGKVRRTLIDEGNLKRYIAYAFGEAFIVVIGILFALQVNNWNESRKEKSFERKVLSEISVAAQDNIRYLNLGIASNEKAISSGNILIKHFKNGYPYIDTLDQHFSSVVALFYPSINNNAYESLKSYGLHLIKNDSIRYTLGFIYEWRYMERLNMRQEEYFYYTVSPILTDLFESNEYSVFPVSKKLEKMEPYDYDELRKSRKYGHILRTLVSNRELQNKYWLRSIEDRERLIKLIKDELNQD